jgi:ABC-type phosphate transport system ATPase subunit
VDPLATDAVEELLARLKAEAEVDAVAIVAQGAARLPREPVADPERPRTPTTQRT